MDKEKFPLGQLLIEKNIITVEQLEVALRKQKETGELLGVILLDLGFVDEETVFLPVLAGQFGVDYINLRNTEIAPDAIQKVPAKFAIHYKICPLDFKNNILKVATTQPLDVQTMDEIRLVLDCELEPILAGEKDIMDSIRTIYGVGADTIEQMMGDVSGPTPQEEITEIDENESEASISKFLNQILFEAHRDRATDIHIEPFEDELMIRYRIDGVLYDAKVPSNIKHFKDAIVSRIKILSNLNIAEKRVPQDGRFKLKQQDVELDLRVSTLPTLFGESVVMRLLNSTRLYELEELGLDPDDRRIIEESIMKPHGIIFLTGPTGSGKTTTLYSCLARVNTEQKKIITIEDPVEYQLKGVTQIQVHSKVGLSFASGLRSMLRHDPDIMMVGEVRDVETAEIAIQVALTGHLVFSTLHTNDAPSGVTRLLDMGVDPYLISSTIECFIAQRLVRLLCDKCKKETQLTDEMVKDFDGVDLGGVTKVYEAVGCDHCHHTGYAGRKPIYEILVMKDAVRKLVMERADAKVIRDAAQQQGMRLLNESGWELVKKGLTSPEEVLRVTKEEELA